MASLQGTVSSAIAERSDCTQLVGGKTSQGPSAPVAIIRLPSLTALSSATFSVLLSVVQQHTRWALRGQCCFSASRTNPLFVLSENQFKKQDLPQCFRTFRGESIVCRKVPSDVNALIAELEGKLSIASANFLEPTASRVYVDA